MTPDEFKKIRDEQNRIIDHAREIMNSAREIAEKCELPSALRPATPADIVANAILWYPRFTRRKWLIVDEVLYPSDAFKAFCDDLGSRYGLDGAFVEIKSGPTPPAPAAAEQEPQ